MASSTAYGLYQHGYAHKGGINLYPSLSDLALSPNTSCHVLTILCFPPGRVMGFESGSKKLERGELSSPYPSRSIFHIYSFQNGTESNPPKATALQHYLQQTEGSQNPRWEIGRSPYRKIGGELEGSLCLDTGIGNENEIERGRWGVG